MHPSSWVSLLLSGLWSWWGPQVQGPKDGGLSIGMWAGLWPLEYFLSVAQYRALTLKNVFYMNFLVENINK